MGKIALVLGAVWATACTGTIEGDDSGDGDSDVSGDGDGDGVPVSAGGTSDTDDDPGSDGGSDAGGTSSGGDGSGGSETGGNTSAGGNGAGGMSSGGVSSGGAGTGGNGTGGAPPTCDNESPYLSVQRLDTTTISEMGVPFSTDSSDVVGPDDWAPQYGKTPEIMPYSSGTMLDVLFQDQTSDAFAYVVNIVQSGGSYVVDHAYEVGSLGRIMGFSKDSSGNYYVATGVDEDNVVDASYPPNDIHRPDVVRIVKFDANGCVLMESDVDMERGAASSGSEIIVNPMVAATSRLAWGGNQLVLVHGHNTEPDGDIGGTRHQKSITTHIDAITGAATRTSSMWVSHSFDQRAMYNGSGFVELHLGDAYPRYVTLGYYTSGGGSGGYPVYQIKGASGANNTYTRLGGIVQTNDPTYGYMVLFATERATAPPSGDLIGGTRDVALVRVESNFMSQSTSSSIIETSGTGVSSQSVTSAGDSVTNYVRWLTNLGSQTHAERPRIIGIGGDEFVVLFERWSADGDTYDGTFAMLVDETGSVLAGPTEMPGNHHIGRGDDIAAVGGRAVYVTGGSGALHLNFIDDELGWERVSLP